MKKVIDFLIKIFWIFIIGSVFGFFIEMLYVLVYTRSIEIRQGLIYGPFIQVYGMGAVAYYLLASKIKEPKQIFFYGMIMGGAVEYLFSFFQEKFFGTISWDYSNLPFNINGRTSLLHCIYWGIGGVLFVKLILPFVHKINIYYKNKYFKILTAFLMTFILFDITMSSLAGARQLERRKNIPADGYVDVFFDTYYTNEKLEQIYSNAKEV